MGAIFCTVDINSSKYLIQFRTCMDISGCGIYIHQAIIYRIHMCTVKQDAETDKVYVPFRRIWLMQPDGAFTIGGMVTSGDELIFPVSFRTVRFPLIINDHDPSIPIWSVLSQQQLANLRWTDNSFQNMCCYTSVTF